MRRLTLVSALASTSRLLLGGEHCISLQVVPIHAGALHRCLERAGNVVTWRFSFTHMFYPFA